MTRPQAAILVIAALPIGLHSRTTAQQFGDAPQTIAQSGASPLQLDSATVNVLKANVAARSASLTESEPKGFWIQSWNNPRQTFSWNVKVPQVARFSVVVLEWGAPASK